MFKEQKVPQFKNTCNYDYIKIIYYDMMMLAINSLAIFRQKEQLKSSNDLTYVSSICLKRIYDWEWEDGKSLNHRDRDGCLP